MKLAGALLIALIVLFSVGGCGKNLPSVDIATPPIILNLPDRPVPKKPVLAELNRELPLDHEQNLRILLERDDIMRALIKALYSSLGVAPDKAKEEIKND